jgi:hypothetical protein
MWPIGPAGRNRHEHAPREGSAFQPGPGQPSNLLRPIQIMRIEARQRPPIGSPPLALVSLSQVAAIRALLKDMLAELCTEQRREPQGA